MSEKFTQGEWVALPIEDDKEYIRIRGSVLGSRYKIANVIDLKNHHDGSDWCSREREESLANANLILASKDMYSLLKDIFNNYETSTEIDNKISKVLAKVDGNPNNTYTPTTKCINCDEVMVEDGVCNCCGWIQDEMKYKENN